jgi:hypothetical protein
MRFGDADSEKLLQEHGDWLALGDGETIEFAAKTVRDFLVFTDRRVIITDTQGMMRRKTEYKSIPYRALSRWSVESKGGGWRDGADLKMWVGAALEPQISLELQKNESARDVMTLLSKHAL